MLDDVAVVGAAAPASAFQKKKVAQLLAEKCAARARAGQAKSKYRDEVKKNIVGSAAEVEGVWSMASMVMTKERSTMSLLLFEMIICLKYNKDLWGLVGVVEANKHRKGESTSAKVCKEAHCKRVVVARADIESYKNDQGVVSDCVAYCS